VAQLLGNCSQKNKLVIQEIGIDCIEFILNHFNALFDYPVRFYSGCAAITGAPDWIMEEILPKDMTQFIIYK
jgi:hypothetical protein